MKLITYRILVVSLALLGAVLIWTQIHPLVTPFYVIPIACVLAVMRLPSWVKEANEPRYRIEEKGNLLFVYRELPSGIFEMDSTSIDYCLKKSGNPIEDCKDIIEKDRKKIKYHLGKPIIHRCE